MTTDTTDRDARRTRRAILGGALGGLGALLASALGRPAAVLAGTDGDVVLGAENSADGTTSISSLSGPTLALSSTTSTALALTGGESGTALTVTGGLHQGGIKVEAGSWASAIFATGDVQATGTIEAVNGLGPGVKATGVPGVWAQSTQGLGLYAMSTGAGEAARVVSQSDGTGLAVYSSSVGSFPAAPVKTGVFGCATQDAASNGVMGQSNAGVGVRGKATSGQGVHGDASTGFGVVGVTTAGTAVYGVASNGTGRAIWASGRVRIDKASGVATIAAGATSVTISPGLDVTPSSFVLLTPRSNIGTRALWYATDATANTITIRISSAMSSGALQVGWLLLG